MKEFSTFLFISITSLSFIGCDCQVLPLEKFKFDSKFDSLYKAMSHTDTLLFENSKNGIDTFVLTQTDSTLFNQVDCFMCPVPAKSIFRNYKQYPINYWAESIFENQSTKNERTIQREVSLITITKYPTRNKNEAYISFKNFHSTIKGTLGTLCTDPLKVNQSFINNYYVFNSTAKSLVISDHHVESVYVTLKDGIIAYKEKSGIFRRRIY